LQKKKKQPRKKVNCPKGALQNGGANLSPGGPARTSRKEKQKTEEGKLKHDERLAALVCKEEKKEKSDEGEMATVYFGVRMKWIGGYRGIKMKNKGKGI